MKPLFDGPAWVACRNRVPIVPIGIGGSDGAMPIGAKLIRPARVRVVIGEPIYPDVAPTGHVPRRLVSELTEALHGEVQRLYDERSLKRAEHRGDAGRSRSSVGGVEAGSAPRPSPPRQSMAASRSRRLRGGGKYSSSSVTLDLLDAVARIERVEHRFDELLGGRGTGGHADGAGERDPPSRRRGSSSTPLIRSTVGQPGLTGEPLEREGVRRVRRTDDDDGVAPLGDRHERRLAVGGGEAQVGPPG